MKLLRANTAVDVLLGPFVDSTDGNTVEDGLTITQADIRLSKNGQNMAQKNDANACTHDELGYYNCPLDATDTSVEGQLDILVHESGALPVKMECMVLAEAAYDSLFTAKDDGFMDVNIKTIGRADAQETEANNLESACANYSVTRGLSGTALPAAAADDAGGLPVSDLGGLDMDAILEDTNELQGNQGNWATAVGFSTHSAADVVDNWETQSQADPTGFHVNVIEIGGTAQTANDNGADINAILEDTNELQADDIPGTLAALNNLSSGDVESAVDAAFENAIPASPTADSINDYIQRMKFVIVNKQAITEANGNTVIYKDDDSTQYCSVAAAYSSDSTTTTKKRLE